MEDLSKGKVFNFIKSEMWKKKQINDVKFEDKSFKKKKRGNTKSGLNLSCYDDKKTFLKMK